MLLIIGLMVVPATVLAASRQLDALYVSFGGSGDGSMPATAVQWVKYGDDYYLPMPGGADLSDARVWFEGTLDTQTINGVAYHNGDRMEGLADGALLTVTVGKKTAYKVHVMQGSAIGAVFVTTESGKMTTIDRKKGNQETGDILILNADGSAAYDGELDYIRLRGNTSVTLDKKNYNFKLSSGADLFGMGKAKRWALLGSFRDHSMIRNQIVYNMADYVGLPSTPEVRQVDVYFNHAYHGIYLLCERIEVNKERVDIADLEDANEAVNDQPLESYPMVGTKESRKGQYKAYQLDHDPEDITGGYIIEYENYRQRYGDDPCAYTTTQGKVLVIKDPNIISVAEMEYISGFMQGYENAIFADNGIDPETGKHYSEFVDFDSLVLKYMLEEISMNADGNGSSQYYYKPADSQSKVAFAGPCWDYDATFACFNSTASRRGTTIDPNIFMHNKVNASLYWWPQLYRHAEFQEAVRRTWKDTYSQALQILLGQGSDPEGRLLSADEYAAAIARSAAMNFIRWPIEKSGAPANNKRTGLTFEANIDFLKDVIRQRYDFLNGQWGM